MKNKNNALIDGYRDPPPKQDGSVHPTVPETTGEDEDRDIKRTVKE